MLLVGPVHVEVSELPDVFKEAFVCIISESICKLVPFFVFRRDNLLVHMLLCGMSLELSHLGGALPSFIKNVFNCCPYISVRLQLPWLPKSRVQAMNIPVCKVDSLGIVDANVEWDWSHEGRGSAAASALFDKVHAPCNGP